MTDPSPKKSKAADTGTAAVDSVKQAADTAKGVAETKLAEAKLSVATIKEQASGFATDAVDAARTAATQGKDMAAQALDELAKFAVTAASTVDERVGTQYGDYARKAASTASNAASALQAKDVDTIVADTTAYVRKRPAIAIGVLAGVGLLIGQLIGRRKPEAIDKDQV